MEHLFPGDEDVMHQKDEYIEIEKLELMTKNLCGSYLQIVIGRL